jgi:hypothetical protein
MGAAPSKKSTTAISQFLVESDEFEIPLTLQNIILLVESHFTRSDDAFDRDDYLFCKLTLNKKACNSSIKSQKTALQCIPLKAGIVKRTSGKIQIILIDKSMKDGKITSLGGSNLHSPEHNLTDAWKLEADIACSADMTDSIRHHKHLMDFIFLGRNVTERREGYHLLFHFAAQKINTQIPPFTVQDFRERVCNELSLLKEKIMPSELPENVRFKGGVVLGDVIENPDISESFNVKNGFISDPSEMNLKSLSKIIGKGKIFIETSVVCGSGNGYAAGSWFLLQKIRENEKTFTVKGPIESHHRENDLDQLRLTKLKISSFIVKDPELSDESPDCEAY